MISEEQQDLVYQMAKLLPMSIKDAASIVMLIHGGVNLLKDER